MPVTQMRGLDGEPVSRWQALCPLPCPGQGPRLPACPRVLSRRLGGCCMQAAQGPWSRAGTRLVRQVCLFVHRGAWGRAGGGGRGTHASLGLHSPGSENLPTAGAAGSVGGLSGAARRMGAESRCGGSGRRWAPAGGGLRAGWSCWWGPRGWGPRVRGRWGWDTGPWPSAPRREATLRAGRRSGDAGGGLRFLGKQSPTGSSLAVCACPLSAGLEGAWSTNGTGGTALRADL